ncbi:hypothetical protein JW905_12760 [bacterium]|nr:hypothetical protein [candidate division CSSED10-310 bacterium]
MAKDYVEIVFEGSHKLLKGFMFGLFVDSFKEVDFFCNRDFNIHARSFIQQLKDHLGTRPEHTHMILQTDKLQEVKINLEKVKDCLHLTILEIRPLVSAYTEFSFSAYTEKDGRRLRALLRDSLPAGVELAGFSESSVQKAPEGKGIEMYAPLHDYELHAHGRLNGEVGPLIRFCWKLLHESLVTLKEIHLVNAE